MASYEARNAELGCKVGQLVMENDLPKKNHTPIERPSGALSSIVIGPTASRSDEIASG